MRELFASGAFDASTTDRDTDNADSGKSIGEVGEGRKYGGMIFTSQRAVEAFVKMIEEEGRMSRTNSIRNSIPATNCTRAKTTKKLT